MILLDGYARVIGFFGLDRHVSLSRAVTDSLLFSFSKN